MKGGVEENSDEDVNDTLVLNPRYATAHAANHYAYPASLYSTYDGGNVGA